MKPSQSIFLAVSLLVPTHAQFHQLTALREQEYQLHEEKVKITSTENFYCNAMTVATMVMKGNEKRKKIDLALERGEAISAEGEPIEPPPDAGVRPIDPRTPTNFGDPFVRAANVEEKFQELMGNLTMKELKMLEELESLEEEDDEENEEMMLLHAPKRGVCGSSMEDAIKKCGSTCDPEVSPFCVSQPGNGDITMISNGTPKSFSLCFPDVECVVLDDDSDIIDMLNSECAPFKVTNPCINDCDCFRKKKKQSQCHKYCSKTDNISVVQCAKRRKKGADRRRLRIAKELGVAKGPCEYNIHYQHPLQSSDQLQLKQLPAFETH